MQGSVSAPDWQYDDVSNVAARSKRREQALMWAIYTGDYEKVRDILSGDPIDLNKNMPNPADEHRSSLPLLLAIGFDRSDNVDAAKQIKVVELLLENGADPNPQVAKPGSLLDHVLILGRIQSSNSPRVLFKETAKLLFVYGARTEISRDYFSPKELAELKQEREILRTTTSHDQEYLLRLYPVQAGQRLPYKEKYDETLHAILAPDLLPSVLANVVEGYHQYYDPGIVLGEMADEEKEEDGDGAPSCLKKRCVIS